MINLPESLKAWNTPDFKAVLKREIARLGASLPLQQGLSGSSYALDDAVEAVVHRTWESDGRILARVGIFYSGVVAGCSCADDPTPVEAQTEYCELDVAIDRVTGEARVSLARD